MDAPEQAVQAAVRAVAEAQFPYWRKPEYLAKYVSVPLDAAYPIIEREVVAGMVKGEFPVARATIRDEVIAEVVASVRMLRGTTFSADDIADLIEREFGEQT